MKSPLQFHSNAVWPPFGWVAGFLIIYGLMEGGLRILGLALGFPHGALPPNPEIQNARAALVGATAGVYALYRILRFHPAANLGYSVWLSRSPWTAARPLPLGPVHLVWQDFVVVGALAALAGWPARVNPVLPVVVFGAVYLVAMTVLLAVTRQWMPCLLLGFLWPALSLPPLRGMPSAGIIVAIIIAVWVGNRRSLRAFPWGRNGVVADVVRATRGRSILEAEIRIDITGGAASPQQPGLGWPVQWISPKPAGRAVSTRTGFLLAALLGWWTYCALANVDLPPAIAFLIGFVLIAAVIRLAIYCNGVVPSFNVWGRLATGRLIVPGFDRVFVTPLAAVAVAIVGSVAVHCVSAWRAEVTAVTVAAIWFVLLAGGPTLRNWSLTGQHRSRAITRVGARSGLTRQPG
jgi:hypothetical protein